jgi:hypothetical protein
MKDVIAVIEKVCVCIFFCFFYGSTALNEPRPPHFEVSRSHTLDTPQSVGLLWTRDQLVADTST